MSKKYALGVDIGGTNIKYIIIDQYGKEIDHYQNHTEAKKGSKHILKNVVKGIHHICSKNSKIRLQGIGIGSPGLINEKGKVVTGAANLPGWNGTNIKAYLAKKINLPIFVDNDVTLVALGEAYFGIGKRYNRVLCLALGTGLGGGIIVNKHIYRGKYGYAGEFGHMIVNPDGPRCTCGNKGCLESYASTVGLKRAIYDKLTQGVKTKILKIAEDRNNIMPIHIFKAYEKGDKVAKQILDEMSYYLSMGIANLYNIFDPDIIILAGGISHAGSTLIHLIKKHIHKFILKFFRDKLNIKVSHFIHKSGVMGTAALVFEKLNIPTNT